MSVSNNAGTMPAIDPPLMSVSSAPLLLVVIYGVVLGFSVCVVVGALLMWR